MEKFPKKYNRKNLIKNKKNDNEWINLYSQNIPLDLKINPWEIFFMFFKDMYCKTNAANNQKFKNIVWYSVSSLYHSSLDTQKSNIQKIQLIKNIQKNKMFLENLWLDVNHDPKYLAMTENFNNYVRQVFADLFSNKKLNYSQNTVNRSKIYQTYIDSSNTIKKEVEIP